MTRSPKQKIATDGGLTESNMGRCDLCGNPVDLTSGDELSSFAPAEDSNPPEEFDGQDVIDGLVRALRGGETDGADLEAARLLEETGVINGHKSCLDDLSLPWEPIPDGGV